MNGEIEYAKMLKQMEKEVLALKTAHQRPLGALNFFKKNLNFTVNLTSAFGIYIANINVVVKIATPTTTPPIVQAGWDTPNGFYSVNFQNFNVDFDYITWTYQLQLVSNTESTANFKFGILSSQPVESITWSYI